MPEIYGYIDGDDVNTPCGGAFRRFGNTGGHGFENTGSGNSRIAFNASRYNVLYGASNTVTPLSITVYFHIKY